MTTARRRVVQKIIKYIKVIKQGRSQTLEQDEATFERRRGELLGGSGSMPPYKKSLKSRGSEMLL